MKQASITITSRNKKKSARILLEGSLSLGNLHTIKEELIAEVSRCQDVELIVRNVAAIDITGIQLLFALKKSAETLHKQLSFDIELPNELNHVISQAGFHHLPALLQSVTAVPVEK